MHVIHGCHQFKYLSFILLSTVSDSLPPYSKTNYPCQRLLPLLTGCYTYMNYTDLSILPFENIHSMVLILLFSKNFFIKTSTFVTYPWTFDVTCPRSPPHVSTLFPMKFFRHVVMDPQNKQKMKLNRHHPPVNILNVLGP